MMIEQPGATLPLVTIFGPPGSALSYAIRDFLYRSDVPFAWVQLATDAQARSEAGVEHLADTRLPICVFADGTRLECPTVRQITAQLGWFHTPLRAEYDLAIYGAGPAGLSAAVYGASEGLKTVLIERYTLGGQAGSSSRIENYLGFPRGISGAELAERARRCSASAPRSCWGARACAPTAPRTRWAPSWKMAPRSLPAPRSAPLAWRTADSAWRTRNASRAPGCTTAPGQAKPR